MWLALWPIVTVAPDVVSRALADPVSEALPALKALYGFGTSSLDVLALTLLRTQLLLALLFLVPASKRGQAADKDTMGSAGDAKAPAASDKAGAEAEAEKGEGKPTPPRAVTRAEDEKDEDDVKKIEAPMHEKAKYALLVLTIAASLFGAAKAAYIAITAPAQPALWPTRGADGASVDSGIIPLFACIGAGLFGTVLASLCAKVLIALKSALFHDSGLSQEERAKEKKEAEEAAKEQNGGLTKLQLARQMAQLVLPDLPLLALNSLAVIVLGQADVLSTHLEGTMVTYATTDPDRAKFMSTATKVMILAGAVVIGRQLSDMFGTFVSARVTGRAVDRIFTAMLRTEKGYYDKHPPSEVLDLLSTNPGQSVVRIIDLLTNVFSTALCYVTTFYLMFTSVTMSQWNAMDSAWELTAKEKTRRDVLTADAIGNIDTIRAFAAENGIVALSFELLHIIRAKQFKSDVVNFLYRFVSQITDNLRDVGILYFGATQVIAGTMEAGNFLQMRSYSGQMQCWAFQMQYQLKSLNDFMSSAKKSLELLNRKPAVPPAGKLTLPGGLAGGFEFRDVVFSYPSAPETIILQDLTLSIKPGQTVAFVGASGGGKSSIMRLIQRFYLPNSGTVMLDGHDLGEYDHRWLRKQMSIVSQEPVLFDRSIYRNIIFGLEEHDGETAPPSLEEVVEAAKQANAHDFIIGLDKGYATKAGPGGSKLSGGQKQRVAIARALVRKPRVLLLDEATSALDAESEGIVQEALDRSCKGRTTIIIAHRLATIKNADVIVVVGKGAPAVKEVGTYDQLVAKGGIFAGLVDKQKLDSSAAANGAGKAAGAGSLLAKALSSSWHLMARTALEQVRQKREAAERAEREARRFAFIEGKLSGSGVRSSSRSLSRKASSVLRSAVASGAVELASVAEEPVAARGA
ncbi:hypothetical protein HXX76_009209 [Chlamydomonas incerta]|uniref:Uncharacterized protein n=1 Tax=Chlamydomonas incerta TaxID=51695 RepID=A0A835VXN0_CHLIN|nr:hypothetical protein HXX76_009209 [Chlamydomonas incerta]|eukprot:KAG2431710.1 hypothetical protein HXX76_009209 [Chlamydomonas incerta]